MNRFHETRDHRSAWNADRYISVFGERNDFSFSGWRDDDLLFLV